VVLAQRLKTLAPSSTLAVQAKARELRARGIDVISFGAGEPDFDTPQRIKDAAVAAMGRGHTKYTEVGGVPELRAAVCAKFRRDDGLDYEPADVVFSFGSKHSLYNIWAVLVGPGDEVIVPSPYWVSYTEQVKLCQGTPVVVPTDEARGFQIDVDAIRRAITPRTKLLLVNTPNNPTGAVYARGDLEALARLAVERDLLVVSDEAYESLSYDGRVPSIASLGPEIKARTLVVQTCSKAYAMTGWRLGFTAGPREIVQAMTDLQGQLTSNPTSIAQWAAIEALMGPQDDVAKMAGEFDRRRHAMIEGLNRIPGVRCPMPQGAFYAFPDVSGLFGRRFRGQPLAGSADVATFLLEGARVAVVAGAEFGSDRHVRLSYACGIEQIREGLARVARACAELEAP
jgi:aspartate aminotransferase